MSLRLRLTLLYTVLAIFFFVLIVPLLYLSVRYAMIAVVDRSLDTALLQALDEMNLEDGKATFSSDDEPDEIAEDIEKWQQIRAKFPQDFEEIETAARLVSPAGELRGAIGDFENIPLWKIPETGYHTLSYNGDSWRVYNLELSHEDGSLDAWLQVTAPLDFVRHTLRIFALALVLVFPFLTLMSAVGAYVMAERALRPIERLTRAAADIDENELSRRIDSSNTAAEISGLVDGFNRMLSRLERAFTRERRFVTDAAHELRTPLTVLKGQIGVALAEERSADDYRRVFTDMEEYVDRLSLLSNDLLYMMRMEQEKIESPIELLDLPALISATIDQLSPLTREKNLTLSFQHTELFTIRGRVEQIIRLLLNLLDNAVKYTPAGGKIEILMDLTDDFVRLSVANTGPGIPVQDLDRVFDRFFRVGTDRSRDTGGSGLGLSIAREIARSHGGDITIHCEEGSKTVFTATFPAENYRSCSKPGESSVSRR